MSCKLLVPGRCSFTLNREWTPDRSPIITISVRSFIPTDGPPKSLFIPKPKNLLYYQRTFKCIELIQVGCWWMSGEERTIILIHTMALCIDHPADEQKVQGPSCSFRPFCLHLPWCCWLPKCSNLQCVDQMRKIKERCWPPLTTIAGGTVLLSGWVENSK